MQPAPPAGPDAAIETDALVIGAGPAGLFQVFELGLLEIKAQVVDSLPFVGGQCVELYADKPIYDIPGVPVCTGRELIAQLQQQIEPMGAVFHLGQEVSAVQALSDGRFAVETSAGVRFVAKTIFVAGGVGSFQPRTIKVEGLAAHAGTQLFHRVDDAARFTGLHLVIVGDDDTALQTAVDLARPDSPHRAASVTLLHRRDAFKASPELVAQMRALCAAGNMRFVAGQTTGIEEAADRRLAGIVVLDAEGCSITLPLDALLVLMGVSPKLGPIAEWGLALERKQVVVDTARFETSTPGIYAVGDVNTYPGKKKLILSGFHEATLAAFAAAARIFPDKPIHLEYTTTSPRLHRVLGVAPSLP
ncbi:NAD(P)/FAD-dependent oxidoreductase [soil metagenome]